MSFLILHKIYSWIYEQRNVGRVERKEDKQPNHQDIDNLQSHIPFIDFTRHQESIYNIKGCDYTDIEDRDINKGDVEADYACVCVKQSND